MSRNTMKTIARILLILIVIFVVMAVFTPKETVVVNKESAFRNAEEIDPNNTMLDDQAIALADSFTSTSLRSEAFEAYNMVNEIREDNGVNTLVWNQNLEEVANVRSKEISESFSHTRPDGKPWYSVNSNIQGGENLAYGYNDAEKVVDAWMDSPTHKDNILYEDFTKMAISIYEDNGTYYWSQEYGY